MSSSLPPISSLPSLPQDEQFKALDTLFEPSLELHTLMAPILSNQTFSSYNSLIDAVGRRMSALSPQNSPTDDKILAGILGSHPRLGRPKAADTEHISELSKREQANLNTGAEEQAEKLRLLNVEYEERFPGLRFVTFVNGRNRDVIMEEMRQRIERGDIERERQETIQAMCDIAKDRAKKLEQSSLN
ncbi:hypothetical protein Asppvi_005043 [Aspergillus pseudoviridinutans]|uniref:Oxo-4-hydroxy-4-carboxy-5-ureidoimidazoline decarboxylase domain-containing protein n=1 Tax=Aspergillus pseudoviridinutans TaxID=1517512 RepID=A0A9P3B8N6_9EURO|nr:uncharacterized protein Asppvi_005043 [Aspergillus pseudoviridinutans]GIJ86165.1 hypothetical protein Asppvi_005043 [Aspergillus pseudoviridinutans]